MGASSFGSTVGGIVMFGVASICFCFLAVSSALDFSMSFRTCSSNELGTELGRQQLQQEFGATTPKVVLEKSQGWRFFYNAHVLHQVDSPEKSITPRQINR